LSAHSSFRLLLKNPPEIFRRPLMPDDTWQERYIVGKDEKSPELRFWLAAARGGNTSRSATLPPRGQPPAPVPVVKSPGQHTPARKMPGKKRPAAKKPAGKT